MPRIAISYRRDNSAAITGRIFDRLTAHYGSDSVFRDIDNIPLGVDFREHVKAMLAETDITLVIIGKRWLGPASGWRRIDDPADPVRVEVETALRRRMPVIPILVEGGGMPKVDQLPDTLKELTYRNGLDVDSGRDFNHHIGRLIRNMDPILAQVELGRAEDDKWQAETTLLAEKRQIKTAGRVKEEKWRAKAALQAEAPWQPEGEKRRAEAPGQAEEEKRWPEKAQRAGEAGEQVRLISANSLMTKIRRNSRRGGMLTFILLLAVGRFLASDAPMSPDHSIECPDKRAMLNSPICRDCRDLFQNQEINMTATDGATATHVLQRLRGLANEEERQHAENFFTARLWPETVKEAYQIAKKKCR
jgi:hypothetical protein